MLPAGICVPADREDVASVIHWAALHHLCLIPRGAGSAMGGGNVGDGIILDLTALPPRLDLEPERRMAKTSASVRLGELNRLADQSGLRLPPDPSSSAWATAGGVVSTNAAGARSVRYGSVRRWVEAVELVTADGETTEVRRGVPDRATAFGRFEAETAPSIKAAAQEIAARFPRTRKNSSGYALDAYLASGDSLDLIIGAEGTLGIVTAVEWRLDPVPPARGGLRITLRSLESLTEAVATLLRFDLSAVELLDKTFLELVGEKAEAVLLVEVERETQDDVKAAVTEAATAMRALASNVDTGLTPEAARRLWELRHAASPILAGLPEERRSLQVIEDACVPVERMSEYVRAVRERAAAYGIPVVIFGHAGDGHIHVNLLPRVTDEGWESSVAILLEEITDEVVRLGGTASGEHGDGRLRAGFLTRIYGRDIVSLFEGVKRSFDPLGILNPGIILPSGEPPISHLKVGKQAAALPEDIAGALRRIEQTGGYARNRLELA
jgi:FAD/FMN-containing dehydrogenase